MKNNRATAICLLKILYEESDADHILSMSQLEKKLMSLCGDKADRRTISSAIDTLIEIGYDISKFTENKKGYYLRERLFEPSELRLLMDAVYSFRGIPEKETRDLIEKIQTGMSKHQKKNYTSLRIVKSPHKAQNNQVFLNIELLDEAIIKKKKISFIYNRYNFDKKLEPRRDDRFTVDPYLLLSANERYYLICNHCNYNQISHFRLDRMSHVEMLDEDIKPAPQNADFKSYVERAASVYFEDDEMITFRCKRSILDDVIDKFGQNVMLYNRTRETFDFAINIAPAAATFFALEYISRCEIIAPEHVRETMRKYIQAGVNTYMKQSSVL